MNNESDGCSKTNSSEQKIVLGARKIAFDRVKMRSGQTKTIFGHTKIVQGHWKTEKGHSKMDFVYDKKRISFEYVAATSQKAVSFQFYLSTCS